MEEKNSEDVACRICGSEICCDPAHGRSSISVVYTCLSCGKSLTVKEPVAAPPICCGREMSPSPGEPW